MKINSSLNGAPNLKHLLPTVLTLFLVITQLAGAVGDSFGNVVLCIGPGDHIAIETESHQGWNESNPGGCDLLCHSHPSGPCTDIPLPKTEPFIHCQTFPGISSAYAQMTTGLPSVRLLADSWFTSLHFRPLENRLPLYSLSVLHTVVLRI